VRRIVFYSWQSDLPNATNRGLIQAALEAAAENIAGDETVAVDPVIDRDTEGVAGSPDIASTIFAKIIAADLVVADISLISAPTAKRQTPNPNVLVEVGYALKTLNFDRVILVFNSAFGKIESLPFDLKMRRVIVYAAAPDETDRASVRRDLTGKLERALRSALPLVPSLAPAAVAATAIEGIENQRPNRRIAVRAELADILKELDALQPTKFVNGGTAEGYLQAISNTQEIANRFSKVAEALAIMADAAIAVEIHNWFGHILERYSLPRGFSGTYSEADFDVFRFVGHELFVTLFAFLLREQQWEIISRLLNEPIPVRYLNRENGPGNAEWSELSRYVGVLGGESQRRQRLSFHGDLLKERHSTGNLAGVLPFEEFADGDFFLYLRGILSHEQIGGDIPWKPWSTLYVKSTPMFLLRAQSQSYAESLTRVLLLPSVEVFKARLQERGSRVGILYRGGLWDYPVRHSDIEKIASRKS
jgi:hypothetical protein